jgi:hypothetical protein
VCTGIDQGKAYTEVYLNSPGPILTRVNPAASGYVIKIALRENASPPVEADYHYDGSAHYNVDHTQPSLGLDPNAV